MPHKLTLKDLIVFEGLARDCLLEIPSTFKFEEMTRPLTAPEARVLAFLQASIAFYKGKGILPKDTDPFVIDLEEADSFCIDPHDWTDDDAD